MTTFNTFTQVAPISEETIARFAGQVPVEVVELWRRQGAGLVGDDGFFRVVDPDRAVRMLEGVFAVPAGSTVLFLTALGDVVVHTDGSYFVVKFRFGAIDLARGLSFDGLVALIEDARHRDDVWEWQPYPAARDRDGVPEFEQCFGFVPLLALGGPNDAEHLQLGGLYEHLALIAQLAGPPRVRGALPIPEHDAPAAISDAATDRDRLIDVARGLFAKLTESPNLNIVDLPDGLGICAVHAVRGGGKIYVAPDESVLFVASAMDFDAGLAAFRSGERTPQILFERRDGGAAEGR